MAFPRVPCLGIGRPYTTTLTVMICMNIITSFNFGLAGQSQPPSDKIPESNARLEPVDFAAVRLTDGFWAQRQDINASATLEHVWRLCDETGRIRNFLRAAGKDATPHEGYLFNDSDVYKLLEGACQILVTRPDSGLRARIDELVKVIVAAQQEDGYLNTYYQLVEPEKRWTDIAHGHEMYCAGHLIEAAIAHHAATGDRTLLDAAIRMADHISNLFGPARRRDVPGHPELELALIRLYRYTGDVRFLVQARFFLSERGRANGRNLHGQYAQDHVPLSDQTQVVGHAVRAMYLYSALTDEVMESEDAQSLAALSRLWDDLTLRKMYVTGGIGSLASNEGFSEGYILPNDEAYSETCASIGLINWSHRMGLLHGEARFFDVMERVLFNAYAAGVSVDGRSFFYANPLGSRGGVHRQSWFQCACCPPNVLRTTATVGGLYYAVSPGQAYVNLYGAGRAKLNIPGLENQSSLSVTLVQRTMYPSDGVILIAIQPDNSEGAGEFTLNLRIPEWADFASLRLNGEPVEQPSVQKGYVSLSRRWNRGDTVEVYLPLAPQRISSHPRVVGNRGRTTLQYGPLVYCIESIDQNGIDARNMALGRESGVTAVEAPDLLGGTVVLKALGERSDSFVWEDQLYRSRPQYPATEITAVPYAIWGNRDTGTMVVWIPENPEICDVADE